MSRILLFLALQIVLMVVGVIGIGGILVLGIGPTLSDEQAIAVAQNLLYSYVIGVILFDVLYWAMTISSGWKSRFLTRVFLAYSCAALLTLVYSIRNYLPGFGRSLALVFSGGLLITTLWLSFGAVKILVVRKEVSPAKNESGGPGASGRTEDDQ